MRIFPLSVLAIAAVLFSFTSVQVEASPEAFNTSVVSAKLKQQSGLTPEQSRKMRERSPYGYAIITYWIDGDKYLKQGQFNDAINQYQKAVDASKVFNRNFTANQNLRLKQCAIAGSEARLKGAIAARDYYKKNSRKESALDEALAISERTVDLSFVQAEAKNPLLKNVCP